MSGVASSVRFVRFRLTNLLEFFRAEAKCPSGVDSVVLSLK